MKFCPDCGENRPLEEFNKESARFDGYQFRCRKHSVRRCVAWRRQKIQGITQEEFDVKFERQGGRCAICGKLMSNDRLHLPCQDHNHVTGENRELLCASCNLLIGHCFEDIEILANAIKYLQKHAKA